MSCLRRIPHLPHLHCDAGPGGRITSSAGEEVRHHRVQRPVTEAFHTAARTAEVKPQHHAESTNAFHSLDWLVLCTPFCSCGSL